MSVALVPKQQQTALARIFGIGYDVLAQLISILDVTTDVIVLISYYNNSHMIFFWISAVIILLALLSYTFAFHIMYGQESVIIKNIGLFIALFCISPFLPFIFFLCDDSSAWFPKKMVQFCYFNLYFQTKSKPDEDMSVLKKWMKQKIKKHIGFLLEALIEAFPQAILQMAAIVYYKEANAVSIISIFISMTSVASKSFVISVGTAITVKQLLFNWLSAVTDFFGLFFAVSWVFYQPANEDSPLIDTFIFIRAVWFYKLAIFSAPLIVFGSIAFFIVIFLDMFRANTETYNYTQRRVVPVDKFCGYKALMFVMLAFFVALLTLCGTIAAVIASEIANWTYLAFVMYRIGTDRYPVYKISSDFWFTLIEWIRSGKTQRVGGGLLSSGVLSWTKSQDQIMRICSANHVLLTHARSPSRSQDFALLQYLQQEMQDSQYLRVSLADIRDNCSVASKSLLARKFLHFYAYVVFDEYTRYKRLRDEGSSIPNPNFNHNHNIPFQSTTKKRKVRELGINVCLFAVVTFVFAPWYFVSRVLNVFFPVLILLRLYIHDDGFLLWSPDALTSIGIGVFQSAMLTVYVILCGILCVLLYLNVREQRWMHHLLPSGDLPSIQNTGRAKVILDSITDHYYSVSVVPFRRAIVFSVFGTDIGLVVLSYLPTMDHCADTDSANQLVLVSTV